MHHRLVLGPALLLLVSSAGGCRFSKATQDQINPPPPPDDMEDGGPIDHHVGIDVNLPPPIDAQLFESEANVNCVEANPQTMNIPPDILIVFDRSGSMNEDLTGMTCRNGGCGVNSKWTIATTTVNAFLPTVETTVNWGLKLFSTGSDNGCTVDNMADVAPGPMNAAAITGRLGQAMPGSSTPTTAALMNAATYLSSLPDKNPKFILLATDGIPTCGTSLCAPGVNAGNNTMQCDDANAIAMVQTVHDMGISTFVLGIGTANSPGDSTLSMMADKGGYPRAATPSYYPIGNAQDLTDAFKTITGMVGSCFFGVTPPPTSADKITAVRGDGNVIPQDATNGWSFVNGANTGVQLNGTSCEDYKSGAIKTVVVDLPCIVI